MVTGASWVHFKPRKTKIGQKTSLTPFFHRGLQLLILVDIFTLVTDCPLQEKDHFNLRYRNKIISIYPSYKAGVKSTLMNFYKCKLQM